MRIVRTLLMFLIVGWLALVSSRAFAQRAGDGFFFEVPRIRAGVQFGYAKASAGSEIFDFVTEELTLGKDDFNSGLFGADLALRVSERFDAVFAFTTMSADKRSEFRDWVGDDGLPIEQQTTFERRNLTASVRYFFNDRGRSVSRFAWIPKRVSPYVTGGAGLIWYEFLQEGEFVDFADLAVFDARVKSSGRAFMAHIGGGIEISLATRIVLSLDGRYEHADASLNRDFIGFDRIDLSGFQFSTGLGFRF